MPPEEMPPEEAEMMPPEGEAPMPPEGGASADDVMSAQDEQQRAQIESIAATAPQPEKPYTYKAIDKMADAMNDFVAKVDPAMQAAEYNPPEGESKLDAPLPAEVYVPFVIIMGFIAQMEGFEKFIIEPESLISDTALAKAAANFGLMGKDKKLMEGLQAGPEAPPEAEEAEMSEAEMESGRMPDDMSPEDEEIVGMM